MPKFGYLGWELRVLYSAWVCVSPAVGYGAKLGVVGKCFQNRGSFDLPVSGSAHLSD